MIKLKDLINEIREGGPGSGKKKGAPKLQDPWNDPAEPVKHKSKLSRKSRSKKWDPVDRQVRSTKGKHAPKLKQFGESKSDPSKGQPMTTQEKNRVISKIHKWDRPQLVQALRMASKKANGGDARANDLSLIYHNELNNRARMGVGV